MILFGFTNLKEQAEKKKMKYINKKVKYYKKLALKELKKSVKRGKMTAGIRISTSLYNNEIINKVLEYFQKSDKYTDIHFSMCRFLTNHLVMEIKEDNE